MGDTNSKGLRRPSTLPASSGFTLIELLVVIAIIALLMSIVLPALAKVKESAQKTICGTQQKDIAMTVRMYTDDYNGTLPPLSIAGNTSNNMLAENRNSRWFRIGGTAPTTFPVDTWRNLGFIWHAGYWNEDFGNQLYCPSKNIAKFNTGDPKQFVYKTYADPVFPTNYTSTEDSENGVRITYHFNPECKSATNRQRKYVRLDQGGSNMILLVDLVTWVGVPHEKGWNIAKGDGSVSFNICQDALAIIKNAGTGLDGTDYERFDNILRSLK